ncbi:MAG: glycosyl hydrolase, partial [Burkholderiales bacterium]|nr:glycosyl hydrolase [Burkholderiales bacterium]
YYTRNDGLQWTHVAGNGLGGELRSLAVHPTDVHVVAAGTANGLYLSRNAGQDFEPLVAGSQVLGAAFDLSGRSLWFGTYAGKAVLMRLALDVGAKPQSVPIPALMDDGIAYIAQNPARRNEVAFATFKRNVFMSSDQGRNWKQIAREGVTHE